jgi:hypothetical protein
MKQLQDPMLATMTSRSKSYQRSRIVLLAAAACAALAMPLMADEIIPTEEPKVLASPAEESHVHFLIKTEFSSGYTTPRGMIVRDQGLTIQPLFLMFVDLYKSDGFINSVTAVGGVWNDLGTSGVSEHAPFGSNPKTHWTEIDPIGGISIGFAKRFTLDVTYTEFVEQILDIPDSQHLETKLSFNDSDFLGAFALHPYVLFWQELEGKATAADVPYAVLGPSLNSGSHPQPGSSFYFELGVTPSYTFTNAYDLKIEAPCRLLLPDSRFYGEYYGDSSTVGLFELGLKASAPLTFMPKGYGNWGAYAGFKYQYYNDKNLYNLNTWNAPGEPTRDNWVFYAGLSVFF